MDFKGSARAISMPALASVLVGALIGCGTPPQAGDAAARISGATLRAGQSIEEASTDVVRLRRIHHVAEIMQKSGTPPARANADASIDGETNPYRRFGNFACEGLGAYAQQRAGLAMLARFNATVADLLAASPGTLGELLSSIEEHRGELEGLKAAESKEGGERESKCAEDLARALVRILTDEKGYVGALAVGGALAAGTAVAQSAEALWGFVQGVLTIVLQEVDQQARAEQLRRFLADERTLKALEVSLGACVRSLDQKTAEECLAATSRPASACDPRDKGFVPISDAALQCILDERRVMAVVLPYFSYRALRQAVFVEIPKPPSADRSARLAGALKTVPDIHEELALYDRLRSAKVPPGQHAAIVASIVELRRIVRGDLTLPEKAKAIRATAIRIAATFEALSNTFGDAKKGTKDLKEKLRALEEALTSL
jgi:hypothetical protein